uniref:Uncharacterized protein n=1 Tax=Leersia perrieri TaxID=77586 RepID=A0A0D9W4F3_9ORYZ
MGCEPAPAKPLTYFSGRERPVSKRRKKQKRGFTSGERGDSTRAPAKQKRDNLRRRELWRDAVIFPSFGAGPGSPQEPSAIPPPRSSAAGSPPPRIRATMSPPPPPREHRRHGFVPSQLRPASPSIQGDGGVDFRPRSTLLKGKAALGEEEATAASKGNSPASGRWRNGMARWGRTGDTFYITFWF